MNKRNVNVNDIVNGEAGARETGEALISCASPEVNKFIESISDDLGTMSWAVSSPNLES